MKISDVIDGLLQVKAEHGDLECYYSADDEGNIFQKVGCYPTMVYTDDAEAYWLEYVIQQDYYLEYTEEELQDMEDDELVAICIIN